MSINKSKPNKELLAHLRARVDAEGLERVSKEFEIGREQLARYLAGIKMHTSTFRGIEVTLAGDMPEAK